MSDKQNTILVLDFSSYPGKEPSTGMKQGLALLQEKSIVRHMPLRDISLDASRESIGEALSQADGVLLCPWCQFPFSLPTHLLDRMPNLRVISGTFDNRFSNWVDIAELQKRDITLIDTSRNMTPTVAEFAFAMTLNLIRDIPAVIQRVRDGLWQTPTYSFEPQEDFVYGDLEGRRIGLAGFGSINRKYARFASGFNCKLMTHDPFVADPILAQYGVEQVESLVELASRSEVFVVGIPPTPSTLGIISAKVINALPRGSLFVLVTRMAVVEQSALWERVRNNELRAAIDVFDPEPPSADAWFRNHPNCLSTPHVAGGVFYCHERCFMAACKDALAVLEGRPPQYAATPRDAAVYTGKPTMEC